MIHFYSIALGFILVGLVFGLIFGFAFLGTGLKLNPFDFLIGVFLAMLSTVVLARIFA